MSSTPGTPVPAGTPPRRSYFAFTRKAGFFVLLFLLIFLIAGFVRFAMNLESYTSKGELYADAIVVLTGGRSRVETGLDLLSANRANRLLISGVNKSTSSAALRARFPEYSELITCCVELDQQSLDTRQNAHITAGWIRDHTIKQLIVVTSDYHMQRALLEIARVAPETKLISHAVSAPSMPAWGWLTNPERFSLIAGEYLKTLAATANIVDLLSNKPYQIANPGT